MTRKRTSENDLGLTGSPARRTPASRTRAKHTPVPAEISSIPVTIEPEIVPAQPAIATAVAATEYVPGREAIAELAYLYWEARGCQGGSPEADWLRAEQELRSRAAAATK